MNRLQLTTVLSVTLLCSQYEGTIFIRLTSTFRTVGRAGTRPIHRRVRS